VVVITGSVVVGGLAIEVVASDLGACFAAVFGCEVQEYEMNPKTTSMAPILSRIRPKLISQP
jgi:hypothetical protein